MVHDGYLKELESIRFGVGLINGKASFKNSSLQPFRNKIFRVYDQSAGKWCSILPEDEIKKLSSEYYFPERGDQTLFYIDEDVMHTVPPSKMVNIFYLKNPQSINNQINTELNPSLHHAIVCYAEYILWLMDNKKSRADSALSIATGIIDALNQNFEIGGEGA